MLTAQLLPVTEINLDEKQAVKRLSALIYFLRGEISLNEFRVKAGKSLPMKLVDLCGSSVSGYMPKLTQEVLGKMLGCTYAAVQTWEKGKKPSFPRLPTFIKIAKLCNLTVNELTDLLFDYSDEIINKDNFPDLEVKCIATKPAQIKADAFEQLFDDLIDRNRLN